MPLTVCPYADESAGNFRDYQEVKVQEQVQKLEVGKVSQLLQSHPLITSYPWCTWTDLILLDVLS